VWLETLDAALHTGEPHEDAFDLCLLVLEAIEYSKEALAPLAWGDLQLMDLIGHAPEFRVSVQSGEPLPRGRAVLCPRAGGAVGLGEANEGWPSFSVSGETVVALRGLQELEAPPTFLKSAVEVSKAILPFWIEFLAGDLPARRNLLGR
jgi:recombinational DNA repair protein (RecF pathway)